MVVEIGMSQIVITVIALILGFVGIVLLCRD